MKTSAHKIIKSWLNKTNFYKLKKSLNKEKFFMSIGIISVLFVIIYFVKPIYFDYQAEKQNLEKKINSAFSLITEINGNISYSILPTPRILIEDVSLDFGESTKDKIKIKKISILVSPLKIGNLKRFELKKILIKDQTIKIYSRNFKKYFNYFTLNKKNTINFIKSKIFFIDEQGNKVMFENINFEEKFGNNKHQINVDTIFSKNKIKGKFVNIEGEEKYLKINLPNLNQSLDIKFDRTTTFKNFSGELKLKVLESIVLLNFKGKDDFIISNSYLRNKFLNSKIDGKISFDNNFYFDLNLGINQINLRRLLMYYPIFQRGGISKKINGRFNITLRSTDSFFGKIKDAKMNLIFENGDIRVEKISAFLPGKTTIKSNISILSDGKKPKIKFNMNFITKDAVKFFRKFGLYDVKQNKNSLFVEGSINLHTNKINFNRIIKNNNEKVGEKEAVVIANAFNEHVMDDGVLGLFDFFKAKKFLKEVY